MKGIKFRSIPITDSGEDPDRPVVGKEAIVLQGNVLGKMICHRGYNESLDYHAVLNVFTCNTFADLVSNLAQGHGANRAEAIKNALTKSREAATDYLAALDHLAQQINGSEAA
ncbi:hypothetical protein [Microbulbifer spongiae]|uniref:DUF5405 domain-containing protein n=1 Tax=Microbulbifer spongiae TaxID=2944933 RepID=A0ABY9EFK3_9GAMM|nr:hypothetical protein [Microbulbifer sp. MI-G]WKD51705.1 hypothetical protein M8T91_18510 [Microbulbifer sp. MI-G]